MKKSQKRQKRLVLVAMVLMIGLVAGMGAMTYSKYITTATAPTQNATAAQWGYIFTVDANNLFSKDYSLPNSDATLATYTTPNGVAVHALGDTKLVAPGTTGSMTIIINGSAEVRAKLTIAINDGYKDIHYNKEYYPLKWTLTDSASGVPLVSGETLESVANKLKNTVSVEFPAGTVFTNRTYTLTWAWAFSENDTKDTIIGLWSAGHGAAIITSTLGLTGANEVTEAKLTNSSKVLSFGMTVSIEQIQKETVTP